MKNKSLGKSRVTCFIDLPKTGEATSPRNTSAASEKHVIYYTNSCSSLPGDL